MGPICPNCNSTDYRGPVDVIIPETGEVLLTGAGICLDCEALQPIYGEEE
jgi:hypothetical protein